jgi:hypothetical protein
MVVASLTSVVLGCSGGSSDVRDRLDLISNQLESSELRWSVWGDSVMGHLRHQDSLVMVLEDSLASARVRASLLLADKLACEAKGKASGVTVHPNRGRDR